MNPKEFTGTATGPAQCHNPTIPSPKHSGPLSTSKIPRPDATDYKVVPLALTPEEASSAISVARKLERLTNAFAIDG